jgi:hypothetical protein
MELDFDFADLDIPLQGSDGKAIAVPLILSGRAYVNNTGIYEVRLDGAKSGQSLVLHNGRNMGLFEQFLFAAIRTALTTNYAQIIEDQCDEYRTLAKATAADWYNADRAMWSGRDE